jgi:glycosyltransferase involved in cell wall biosynthesis
VKLVHLAEFYAGVGGLERYLHAVCDALEADGHENAVLHAVARGDEPRAARAAHHVPALAGPAGPAARAALDEVLAREKPDAVVVHHQRLDAAVLARIAAGYPTVWWAHCFKVICPGGRRAWRGPGRACARAVGYACLAIAYHERCMPRDPRAGLPLIRRALALAALHRRHAEVVVASGFMRDLLLANRFARDRVHVLPYFTALPPVPPPGRPGALLCAARLAPEKGVHLLLEAMARLPQASLTVAGDGPERGRLEARAAALGLGERVAFAGWLEPPAVAAAMAAAEVVVVPSVWPEPFGIVGIEAMAQARPVVAFDVGGVREWLAAGETGRVVPPEDVPALAGAINALLHDPATRERFGGAGRAAVARRFTAAAHVEPLVRVARHAAERHRAVHTALSRVERRRARPGGRDGR